APLRASATLGGVGYPVEERELHVLERGAARQQLEALEDEAQIVAAQQGALLAREAGRGRAGGARAARRRRGGSGRSLGWARRGSRGCAWRSTSPSPSAP